MSQPIPTPPPLLTPGYPSAPPQYVVNGFPPGYLYGPSFMWAMQNSCCGCLCRSSVNFAQGSYYFPPMPPMCQCKMKCRSRCKKHHLYD